MKIPKSIVRLIESFQSLPGIGPKSAQRLTFHLLHFPQEHLERFAASLIELKKGTQFCVECKNVGESEICSICSDNLRNRNQIMVVASPMDAYAIEKTGYKGLYHVLHGLIDPLNSIGPEELFVQDLIRRLKRLVENITAEGDPSEIEVILSTNTSMEGESTSMYIAKLIRDSGFANEQVKITRIARGLPVGGDIEYADEITLSRAIEGRSTF